MNTCPKCGAEFTDKDRIDFMEQHAAQQSQIVGGKDDGLTGRVCCGVRWDSRIGKCRLCGHSFSEPVGSATWPYVAAFAREMEGKLACNRHKGDREGWLALDMTTLRKLLFRELDELEQAISWGDANAVTEEAADVANFAMMIADKFAHQYQQQNTKLSHGSQQL